MRNWKPSGKMRVISGWKDYSFAVSAVLLFGMKGTFLGPSLLTKLPR